MNSEDEKCRNDSPCDHLSAITVAGPLWLLLAHLIIYRPSCADALTGERIESPTILLSPDEILLQLTPPARLHRGCASTSHAIHATDQQGHAGKIDRLQRRSKCQRSDYRRPDERARVHRIPHAQ